MRTLENEDDRSWVVTRGQVEFARVPLFQKWGEGGGGSRSGSGWKLTVQRKKCGSVTSTGKQEVRSVSPCLDRQAWGFIVTEQGVFVRFSHANSSGAQSKNPHRKAVGIGRDKHI